MNTEDKQPKDDFVYFNDEWNGSLVNNPELRKHQKLYNELLNKINNLLEENFKNEEFQNQTFLPEEFKIIKNNKPDGRRYKK